MEQIVGYQSTDMFAPPCLPAVRLRNGSMKWIWYNKTSRSLRGTKGFPSVNATQRQRPLWINCVDWAPELMTSCLTWISDIVGLDRHAEREE